MTFTDGKSRIYENMMRQIPNFKNRTGGKAKFKYAFADLECRYCDKYKVCRHELCPHIMENLDDLKTDKAFQYAVDNAETCNTPQKRTLEYLRERRI